MRLLLDTHALIWFVLGDSRLPAVARAAIEDSGNEVFASAASAWEVATKFRKGKLSHAAQLAFDFEGVIEAAAFQELPIRARHASLSGRLPLKNPDPFDRMLVAQAVIERLVLVSNETEFEGHGAARLWNEA